MEAATDCEALAQAVIILNNSTSTQAEKNAARKLCRDFKSTRTYLKHATCGLQLASDRRPTVVQRYGIQALKDFVEHLWDLNSMAERRYLRDGVIQLLSQFSKPISERAFKDDVVSVVVEIIKQDWPENWLGLFSELSTLCKKGPLQAELVMLILLQIEEFTKSLPHGRWGIIDCALQRNVREALEMIRSSLWVSLANCKHRQTKPDLVTPIQECCSVMPTTLKALAGYLNRVEPSYIMENNFQLLEKLWCLLADRKLQLEVADCLLIAINKVTVLPGCKSLLVVFANETKRYNFPAVKTAIGELKTSIGDFLTIRLHDFLKKMCQIACIFGQQLCCVLGSRNCITLPFNFVGYLDHLLGFTAHSSQRLSSMTQVLWKSLFSHKLLFRESRLLAVLPRYLQTTRTHLMEVGFPSKTNHPACRYSRVEFATDEDFCKFLIAFRYDQEQVIDFACELDKSTCFTNAITWLQHLLLSSDTKAPNSPSSDGWCNASLEAIEWEAMTFYLKIISTRLFENLETYAGPLVDELKLLEHLLKFKTKDPLVLSYIPATIAIILPLLELSSERLQVLTKLLEIIQDIESPKALQLSSARKDAVSCVHQICKENAQFLISSFETLFGKMNQLLCNDLLQLTQMEKNLLMEAMVVLINEFKNYEQQKAYLEELMAPVASLWLSEEMQKIFANPKAFVSYVGADLQVIDVPWETNLNRSRINHCIATIIGVLQWTRCPTDHEQANAGGFFGVLPSGKLICRNPCTDQVLKLLDNVLLLIQTQHNLYLPEVFSDMCDLFPLVLDRVKVRNTSTLDIPKPFLDICDPPEYKTSLERMQGFFSTLYDCCFYILGCATSALKDVFYVHDFINRVCSTAFNNIEFVPNYRHISMVCFFLKPLLSDCPPEYYKSLVHRIMRTSLPSLHALSHKWNVIDQGNVANKKKTDFTNTGSHDIQPKRLKLLTEELMEFVIDRWVSNEDEKTFAVADVADGTNSYEESPNIVDATSRDNIRLSNKEVFMFPKVDVGADTAVCTTESDDDECPCVTDECNNIVEAGNYVQLSVSNEKAEEEDSVVLEKCDFTCHFPCENRSSVVDFDSLCSLAIEGADPKVVLDKANSVHSLFIKNEDASVVALESDDGELAAEVPQPD